MWTIKSLYPYQALSRLYKNKVILWLEKVWWLKEAIMQLTGKNQNEEVLCIAGNFKYFLSLLWIGMPSWTRQEKVKLFWYECKNTRLFPPPWSVQETKQNTENGESYPVNTSCILQQTIVITRKGNNSPLSTAVTLNMNCSNFTLKM